MLELSFEGEVWFWRGPAPFHFVTVPQEPGADIESIASGVSYGWGMIPANVTIGTTRFYTALWPKDGGYIVPLKAAVREAEGIELGDVVTVGLSI